MKNELLKLIDEANNIKAKFLSTSKFDPITFPISTYNSASRIANMPEFITWKEKILYELSYLKDNSSSDYVTDTIEALKRNFDDIHALEYFEEILIKLSIIKDNFETLYEEKYSIVNPNKASKIFISHSSKDINYVKEIVKLLQEMNVPDKDIFCSSVPGHGIPITENIFDYLKKQFKEYNLYVLLILSENYYNSIVCLNEMGAAWVVGSIYTSILLPGFDYEDISGIIDKFKIAIKLDDSDRDFLKDNLNQLKAHIATEFVIKTPEGISWERIRNQFIDKISQIENNETNSKENIKCNYTDNNDIKIIERGVNVESINNLFQKPEEIAQIYIMAFSGQQFIHQYKQNLIDIIVVGGNIKILLAKTDTNFLRDASEMEGRSSRDISQSVKLSINLNYSRRCRESG